MAYRVCHVAYGALRAACGVLPLPPSHSHSSVVLEDHSGLREQQQLSLRQHVQRSSTETLQIILYEVKFTVHS